jgi:hypothetical protein
MRSVSAFSALLLAALCCATNAYGQDGHESDPATALMAAIGAACRADESKFATYLTVDNAAAFLALPADQKTAFLERLSLSDQPGKPLISSDDHNRTVLRCVAPAGTAEFRFGDVRLRENLAFIPVSVVNSQQTEFGMVRETGGWRLISLGLVLLDIPELSKQWSAADLAAREDAVVATLQDLAEAIHTYRRAWGRLPETLTQLGPAPKDQISPDQASLVNEHVAAGSSGGYQLRYRIVPTGEEDLGLFELAAMPEEYGKNGKRSFLLDSSGKVHAADRHGDMATLSDPTIPQSPESQ